MSDANNVHDYFRGFRPFRPGMGDVKAVEWGRKPDNVNDKSSPDYGTTNFQAPKPHQVAIAKVIQKALEDQLPPFEFPVKRCGDDNKLYDSHARSFYDQLTTQKVFSYFATPWELKYSTLCNQNNEFIPVLRSTPFLSNFLMETVVAHVGYSVSERNLVAYGTPELDKEGRVGGDGVIFVLDQKDPTLVDGWRPWGHPQTEYTVLTMLDGTVAQFLNIIDRQPLKGANWIIDDVIAVLIAPMAVDFAYDALDLCTALFNRTKGQVSRRLLAGPTEELVNSLVDSAGSAVKNTVKEVGLEQAMASRGLKFGG